MIKDACEAEVELAERKEGFGLSGGSARLTIPRAEVGFGLIYQPPVTRRHALFKLIKSQSRLPRDSSRPRIKFRQWRSFRLQPLLRQTCLLA